MATTFLKEHAPQTFQQLVRIIHRFALEKKVYTKNSGDTEDLYQLTFHPKSREEFKYFMSIFGLDEKHFNFTQYVVDTLDPYNTDREKSDIPVTIDISELSRAIFNKLDFTTSSGIDISIRALVPFKFFSNQDKHIHNAVFAR